MAINDSDLAWYRSITGDSEGGAKSVTTITSGVDNNLFPDLSAVNLAAGGTRYRKVFLGNNSGADSLVKPVFWISVPPTNVTERLGLGFDDADDNNGALGTLTQWTSSAILEVTSSGSDTRSLTIVGVNSVGTPVSETIVLNGTTPVPTSTVWSKVWAVHASALSGSRAVVVKQGAAGTTRGTLAPGGVNIWSWNAATSKGAGVALPDLGAGQSIGIWYEQVWIGDAGGVRPNDNRIRVEEA